MNRAMRSVPGKRCVNAMVVVRSKVDRREIPARETLQRGRIAAEQRRSRKVDCPWPGRSVVAEAARPGSPLHRQGQKRRARIGIEAARTRAQHASEEIIEAQIVAGPGTGGSVR